MGSELAEVALGVKTKDDESGVKVVQRVVMD